MRKKIYKMVHIYEGNILSVIYKWFMISVIGISLIPLASKEEFPVFSVFEWTCFVVFVLDYILRWITADYKFGNNKILSFIKYPFRLISIIDLLSIFALLCAIFGWFDTFVFLVVFRVVRVLRYSKGVRTIFGILKQSQKPLVAVCGLAVGYIIISAIIIFNVEPQSFDTFFDAVYWATISLTTVGYGDLYPVTIVGRVVAMISSFLGIAIVALPAGIVTAEYLSVFNKKD